MITRRTLLQSSLAPVLLRATQTSPVIGFANGTYGMKTMTTGDALRTLAEIGYDGVELCAIKGWPTDPEKLSAPERKDVRKLIGDTGLAVPAMLESLPVSTVPDKRAANLERLKQTIALGHELVPSNPPVIDTILGGKSTEWEELKRPIVDTLGEWAKVAESTNTTVCFKPHAAQAINSPERTLWVLNQVKSPRIRIIYDYSHFYVEGFPLESSLKQLLRYIAFISVKDAEGTPAKHEYLLPGDGKTDYLAYFRLLKEVRYSGWVGVEISMMIHSKPGYQPVPTVRLCYERLAPLLAKAGIERPKRVRHSA